MINEERMSPRGPDPVAAYPHARLVGDWLFISGIGPHRQGETALPATFDDEVRGVFTNLGIILEDCGSGWEGVVDVTGFLTDLDTDFAAYNRIYAEYLGHVRPARTTIQVSALPRGIHVELKVIAIARSV
jgi:2-aminomuconate deaminase